MAKGQNGDARVIVVGYDGSTTAKAAVDRAAREAGPDGQVYVVHAYDDHPARGRAVIDGLAMEDDPLLDTNWEAELVEGPASDAILAVAHTRDADEIIVGSHGRGPVARAALGSVSHDLLSRADLPVLVIPHVPGDR